MVTKILIVLLAFTIVASSTSTQGFLKETKDRNEEVYDTLLNFFEVKADVDIKDLIFGVTRDYWNGMLNAYMGYDKNWKIGNWCMDKPFQNAVFAGIGLSLYKTLTLQYLNVMQLISDLVTSYQYIKAQLVYCKGSTFVDDLEKYMFKTMFFFEAAAFVKAFVKYPVQFVSALILWIANVQPIK